MDNITFESCAIRQCDTNNNIDNYAHFKRCHCHKYFAIISRNNLVDFEIYILNYFVDYVNNSSIKSKLSMIKYLFSHMIRHDRTDMMLLLINGLNFSFDDEANQKIISKMMINAIHKGNSQSVRFLIELGANVNALDSSKNTYLWYVCVSYYRDGKIMAKLFLDRGLDPNAHDYLSLACYSKQTKVAKLLIRFGSNISACAMTRVIFDKNEELIKLFLNHGANVEETAVYYHQHYGKSNHQLVSLLTDAGMDPITVAQMLA